VGSGHTLGEKGGEQAHTVSIAELPTHAHAWNAVNIPATTSNNNPTVTLSQSVQSNLYSAASNLQAMAPNMVGNVGGSQAHLNMQPFLTLTFCIALQGIFPSPN
jgi:microcystin-dependent protein